MPNEEQDAIAHLLKVEEEAAELIQAINKHERKGTEETRKAIIDEIGDLLIILDGYAHIHGITDQDIVDRINYKLSLKKED